MLNRQILQGDALEKLKEIPSNTLDELITDPPYGYSFMNKDWDKAVVSVEIWKECLRVLKPGAFAFVMSAPRQDVMSHMIVNLTEVGFKTDFTSMYWAYASGFPKASNIGKMVDKRNGRDNNEYKKLGKYLKEQRQKLKIKTMDLAKYFPSKNGKITGCIWNWENRDEVVPTKQQWIILKEKLQLDNSFDELIEREEAKREVIGIDGRRANDSLFNIGIQKEWDITKPATDQAKKLDGSYAGFQPKPAVEVILVCMKPLSEKNYVEQAMDNGKGVTWLDDCRVPYKNDDDKGDILTVRNNQKNQRIYGNGKGIPPKECIGNSQGRFPANLLVSDDALNDGKITSHKAHIISTKIPQTIYGNGKGFPRGTYTDYPGDSGSFSRYFDVDKWAAQFFIVPKPSKSEKNKGLEDKNNHPTVKPITLLSYLVTLGSREGDTILDPFAGSGTTLIAASLLKRDYIGIEIDPDYCKIAQARLDYWENKKFEKIERIKKQASNPQTLEAFQ